MKSIFSILSAAVCFNLALPLGAQLTNYSLWPRRPAELEQARQLLFEHKGAEAAHILLPFIKEDGVTGSEARRITGLVNVPRYLSRRHPHAKIYTVKRGDTLVRVANTTKCPADILMLLNGMVEVSGLKIGQKLVYIPMKLRMEIHPAQKELSVWDGDRLVADYRITAHKGIKGIAETTISAREGHLHNKSIPPNSYLFPSSNRVLRLANGIVISGGASSAAASVTLSQADMNELGRLMTVSNQVTIHQPKAK